MSKNQNDDIMKQYIKIRQKSGEYKLSVPPTFSEDSGKTDKGDAGIACDFGTPGERHVAIYVMY